VLFRAPGLIHNIIAIPAKTTAPFNIGLPPFSLPAAPVLVAFAAEDEGSEVAEATPTLVVLITVAPVIGQAQPQTSPDCEVDVESPHGGVIDVNSSRLELVLVVVMTVSFFASSIAIGEGILYAVSETYRREEGKGCHMIDMSVDDCGYGDGKEDDACEEVHLSQFV
jgi:hypothetical protein